MKLCALALCLCIATVAIAEDPPMCTRVTLPPGPAQGGSITLHFAASYNTPDLTVTSVKGDAGEPLAKRIADAFAAIVKPPVTEGKPVSKVLSMGVSADDSKLLVYGGSLGGVGLTSTDPGLLVPPPVSNLAATVVGKKATLTWTIPDHADLTGIYVVIDDAFAVQLPADRTQYVRDLPDSIPETIRLVTVRNLVPGAFAEVNVTAK